MMTGGSAMISGIWGGPMELGLGEAGEAECAAFRPTPRSRGPPSFC